MEFQHEIAGWKACRLERAGDEIAKVRRPKLRDQAPVVVPPPSLSGQSPPLWTQLPQPNRHRLLWLLSQLLERQLLLATAINKERHNECDHYSTTG